LLAALHAIERSPARRRSRRNARERSTSTSCYTAAGACASPASPSRIRECMARVRPARSLTSMPPRIPGRGLARRYLPSVRGQRIARTRTHVLR
jgi:hypothetical protein